MNRFLKALSKAFFPQRCAYCGDVIAYDELMCDECRETLPRIKGEVCVKCGVNKEKCTCKKAEKYYERVIAPFYFKDKVRKGLHSFKFRRCPDNAESYCEEMARVIKERYSEIEFDFITGVPLTDKSIKKRGYNQCSLLAKGISELTGIEYKENILKKIYETNNQHDLSSSLRKGNLIGVFDVENPLEVKDKVILICDDVSTSGETFNECAKMLWLYGAKEIYCVSVAITLKGKKQ